MTRGSMALLLAGTALVPLAAVPVFANPIGSNVVAGTAAVSGEGTSAVTVNQSSDKAIIDWHGFNIGVDESTQFVQPTAQSVTLNRVTGGEGASSIEGQLKANGQVFLVNPDGIVFGKNAQIDVGGLVATTHDIANADFMSGNYAFTQPGNPDASVVNLGTINVTDGGMAALVAPGVRNAGTITARLGRIGMAAANGFTLDFYGDNLINLAVDDSVAGQVIDVSTGKPLADLVGNSGLLKADGGTVQLTAAAARSVVDSVINNSGTIEANSVGIKNGKIVLSAATAATKPATAPTQKVAVSGKLSASGINSGESGGKVVITGEDIALTEATIDAFGWSGGGTVLVGGDVQGGNPNPNIISPTEVSTDSQVIPHATTVSMDASSAIDASATEKGNGGKVVLWSDGTTEAHGVISAKGGPSGGDGGFAEVSGYSGLDYSGLRLDVSAPLGTAGTALFDPYVNAPITTANVSTIDSLLNQGADAVVYGLSVSVLTDIRKTAGGEATLKLFGDDGIDIAPGIIIGSSAGALNVVLDADANYNFHLPVSGGGTAQLPGADPQYPGTATSSEHTQAMAEFNQDSVNAFSQWLVTGGPLPAILATRVLGQDAFTAWAPYITQDELRHIDASVLVASNANILTNGGTVTYYSHHYSIAVDDIYSGYAAPGLASTFAARLASHNYTLTQLFYGNCTVSQCYYYARGMTFARVQDPLPSGVIVNAAALPATDNQRSQPPVGTDIATPSWSEGSPEPSPAPTTGANPQRITTAADGVQSLFNSPSVWSSLEGLDSLESLVHLLIEAHDYQSVASLIDTLHGMGIEPPASLLDYENQVRNGVGRHAAEIAVKGILSAFADEALDALAREGHPFPREVAHSLVDTAVNAVFLDVSGEVVDQSFLIVQSAAALNVQSANLVNASVDSAANEINELNVLNGDAANNYKALIYDSIQTNEAVAREFVNGSIWPSQLDTGYRYWIIDSEIKIALQQKSGESTARTIDIAKELATNLDKTTPFALTALGIKSANEYQAFANRVADQFGIAGW